MRQWRNRKTVPIVRRAMNVAHAVATATIVANVAIVAKVVVKQPLAKAMDQQRTPRQPQLQQQ